MQLRFLLGFALVPLSLAAEPFSLNDGDRVVLVGNTLIEREQRYGYWETALTSRFPKANVTFRNLGWSGDTVYGEARAGFGKQPDGFNHLKEHVLSLKPTVIIVGYGGNEAFDGVAGLPKFEAGLNTLLDTFAPAKARIVLLAPPPQEDLGRPLPDPTEQNKNLKLYGERIREIAKKRELGFVDLYELFSEAAKESPTHLTENSLHLNAQGYYRTVPALTKGLGLPLPGRPTLLSLREEPNTPPLLKITRLALPAPPPPPDAPAKLAVQAPYLLSSGRLNGKQTLEIDGKESMTADAKDWSDGVTLSNGPDFDQAEKLRQTIVEKNRLYFHRWRPQNETYLFGFRKHEQGKNSVEIPQFDPLIVTLEEEIAKLRVPVAHVYELKKAK